MISILRRRTSFLLLALAALLALWILRDPSEQNQTGEEITEAPVVVATPVEGEGQNRNATSVQAVAPQIRPQVVDENQKVRLLHEILAAGNDNDMRMDSELKTLTSTDRDDLRSYYKGLAKEDRNSRGTTVFLLGRNLRTKEDFQFFSEVLAEEPCHSLTDCEMAEDPVVGHSEEHDTSQAVTLVYPQLVALKGLERAVADARVKKSFLPQISEAIQNGRKHPDPKVRKLAEELATRISE